MLGQSERQRSLPLFDKYGGMRALHSVIVNFYDGVLDSDIVGPFFDDVDMAKLIDHQTKLFASILGGPAKYTDQRLASGHHHLTVTNVQFDEVIALLDKTLTEAGFAPDDLSKTLRAVEARRSLIVR
ncbi:group 1 truncated hemoglobin [uncultured Ruegeria sp.]|uniref:group I truncated hemoglobin n=1 Tax=uncultured Ruegeria sp. TaxID=259304 RepID=UPI002609C805|nr:group 1 truncated hemoglobin [uncultured Ruegeria sp.]